MKDTDEPRVIVKPVPGITREQARDARARAWRFVFDCWKQKKAAREDGGEDTKKEKEMSLTRETPQS